MDKILIFLWAFIGWYGIDGILNRRILFGRYKTKLYTGTSAIFKGFLAFTLSSVLLIYSFDSFINPQTRLLSLGALVLGIISSFFVNKWLYNPKTLKHPSKSPLFSILIKTLLAVVIIFIIVATLIAFKILD